VRLLWVTDEALDPAGGGGSIRQYQLVGALSRRIDVDVLSIDPVDDPGLRSTLRRVVEVGRPPFPVEPEGGWKRRLHDLRIALMARDSFELRVGHNVRAALAPRLTELVAAGDYDVVHFEHAVLAPLVTAVREARPRAAGGPAAQLTLQNLSSVRSDQLAAVADHWRHRWMWAADARRCRALERRLGTMFERVMTCSEEDAALLPPPVLVVPNGVDVAAFPTTPLPSERRMLFSGSLLYPPNADGATWFCREVLPEVRRRVPEARLSLVGRQPTPEVRALAGLDGVDASFDVPAVQPYLAAARVSVVPLRAGSGTRLKALEAMAAGRPLAGTTIGLEGLGLVDGKSAVIRDDPAGLAAGIAELLTDDARAGAVRDAASALVADLDWEVIADRWLAAMGTTVGS
jgi:glycosyltransferase involved in cell wall biosynthesis